MTEIAEQFSLEGKTAVVTGTSAGIGARLARTLVVAGAQVVAMARRTTYVDLPSSSLGELIPMNVDLEQHDQVADAHGPASRCSVDGWTSSSTMPPSSPAE